MVGRIAMTNRHAHILVYGPSGVGKSATIAHALPLVPGLRVVDLDAAVDASAKQNGFADLHEFRGAVGDAGFLEAGRAAVEKSLLDLDAPFVVDVGAGFLAAAASGDWLREQSTIAIVAQPEFVYHRICAARSDPCSFEGYRRDEFSDRRLHLYAQASETIKMEGLSPNAAGVALAADARMVTCFGLVRRVILDHLENWYGCKFNGPATDESLSQPALLG